MRLLEQGLWSAYPREIWDMELRLAEHQGSDFRLISPDEPEARAAFMEANPELVKEREAFLTGLTMVAGLFDDNGDDDKEEEVNEEPDEYRRH